MTDPPDLFGYGSMPEPPKRPPEIIVGVPNEVVELFERLALQVASTGRPRYSARAILHRIRWHYDIERGIRDFKCNNNWTPRMARWFLAKHAELPDFFETRESAHHGEDDGDDV